MTVQQTAKALALLLHDPDADLNRIANRAAREVTQQLRRNEASRMHHYRTRGRTAPRAGASRTTFRKMSGRAPQASQ